MYLMSLFYSLKPCGIAGQGDDGDGGVKNRGISTGRRDRDKGNDPGDPQFSSQSTGNLSLTPRISDLPWKRGKSDNQGGKSCKATKNVGQMSFNPLPRIRGYTANIEIFLIIFPPQLFPTILHFTFAQPAATRGRAPAHPCCKTPGEV